MAYVVTDACAAPLVHAAQGTVPGHSSDGQ